MARAHEREDHEPIRSRIRPKGKHHDARRSDIHIERIFNAPRERVWRAFTDPSLVAQWWGRGNRLVVEKMEVERGGHWRFVEHSADGVHGFEGRYREVTPPERLVHTFEWDGMSGYVCIETVTFEDLGDGRTKVVNTSLSTRRRNAMACCSRVWSRA